MTQFTETPPEGIALLMPDSKGPSARVNYTAELLF